MKGNAKKLLIFEVLIIIALFLNNFVSSILSGYIEVLFLIGLLVIFYFIFAFERDRHHLWRNVCSEILIFLLIFFILYYVLGLFVSFAKVRDYYNFNSIINVIIPLILVIILKEVLRYMMVSKAFGNKIVITLSCILFVLVDLIGRVNLSELEEKYAIFIFIATIVIPIIGKNILCTYITYKVGYKPAILYLLITTLYGYLMPIIPNPNQYIYSIIWLIMPFFLFYKLYLYLKKDKHDAKIERDYNKKKVFSLILPLIFVVILVYFVSGYFHHQAIVVASGSMETVISKGDIVIVEKIDGNTDLLELNQVIAYNYNRKIVVHRLVKKIVVNGETIYYTKGDANNDIDSYKVTKDMIIGIVNFKIPYIGYPTVWINEL